MSAAVYLIGFCLLAGLCTSSGTDQSCDRGQVAEKKFLLYDVNPGEGFNLRRDVYMRMAILIKKLQKLDNWVLVLPPWGPLYHWKSKNVGKQERLPWSRFFNIESLKHYILVVELSEILKDKLVVDQTFYLQHLKSGFSDRKWEEKYEFTKCSDNLHYQKENKDTYLGYFWKYSNIVTRNLSCVSFQGHTSKLIPLLQSSAESSKRFIMVDRAEIPLHDNYGNIEYWKVRRSMRFATRLYDIANAFRKTHLNSDDLTDGTVLPDDWRDEERRKTGTKGGPYICGHLRRQDFLRGRSKDVPSLKFAAKQLRKVLKHWDVKTVFIASDGTDEEMEELRGFLAPSYNLLLFRPSLEIRREIQDGGAAIVEQIICSRARHFIGTYESTFSFRIQEEREILNFAPETTFNRFCGDEQKVTCEQPAKWRIVF